MVKYFGNLLTNKFITQGLVVNGVYTAPNEPINLQNFNVQINETSGGPINHVRTLPNVTGATLNLQTGEASGVGGSTENIRYTNELIAEILKLHGLLSDESNTVTTMQVFRVEGE